MAKPKVVEPQLLRRLDRSRLAGSSDDMLELVMSDKSKTHFLFRIGGVAIGVISGKSQYGEWHKLVGRFKAQTRTGNVYIANAAFLPGDASQIIADKLMNSDKDDLEVRFLFDVYVRYDSSLATKYGFIVDRVRKPDESDPVDDLFNEAPALPSATTKALAAPEEKE